MSTKANWPELRADKNVMNVEMGGQELWYVRSPQRIEFSIHGEAQQTEARARQICALPKIVELLVELEKERVWIKTPLGESPTDIRTPLAGKVYAILREIGEVE